MNGRGNEYSEQVEYWEFERAVERTRDEPGLSLARMAEVFKKVLAKEELEAFLSLLNENKNFTE